MFQATRLLHFNPQLLHVGENHVLHRLAKMSQSNREKKNKVANFANIRSFKRIQRWDLLHHFSSSVGCEADLQRRLQLKLDHVKERFTFVHLDVSRNSQNILYLGENVFGTGTFPVQDLFPRLSIQPGELVLSQSQTHAALLSAHPHQPHRRRRWWVSEKVVWETFRFHLVTWNLPGACAGLAAAFPVTSAWTACRDPPGATPTCVSLCTNSQSSIPQNILYKLSKCVLFDVSS